MTSFIFARVARAIVVLVHGYHRFRHLALER